MAEIPVGIRDYFLSYLRANSGARVPEGVEDCLQRMTITAMIAGEGGQDAAAPTLLNIETSATPAGGVAKKGILDRMRGR